MPDTKADNLGKEKPDMADELLAVQEKVLKNKLIAREFGIDNQTAAAAAGLATKGGEPDITPAGVVSSVMVAMTNMQKQLADTAQKKEEDVKEARKNEDTTKQQFFQLQADILNAARAEMTTIMREIQTKNTPAGAIAGFKEFKAFFDDMSPKPPPSDGGEKTARMVDNQTALKLEEMHQNHALAMKKLDLEIGQQRDSFQLQLVQFKEDSERRWQEYRDGKALRGDALGGFQDFAAAIAAGIDKGRGVSAPHQGGIDSRAASVPEEHPGLPLKQFKCQFCHNLVTVDDPDADSVLCPTPGCDTEFHLKPKGS